MTPQDVALDPRLLDILVCPLTKGKLSYDRAAGELVSAKAGLAYPIRDGIPIMLPEEARVIADTGPEAPPVDAVTQGTQSPDAA